MKPAENTAEVVDDQTLLLGLDWLYRGRMRRHEEGELLGCARALCAALQVEPADVPVEGYYGETPSLTEYFLRMRALQDVKKDFRPRVEELPAFKRLEAVTQSPMYGRPEPNDRLFPRGRDPLTLALLEMRNSSWEVQSVATVARGIARNREDISFVGLAAWLGDPVLMTAFRESVVLYAAIAVRGGPSARIRYEWRVDPELAERVGRFVRCFNELFGDALPEPTEANAGRYWNAATNADIGGRCVYIGRDDSRADEYYHWAIDYSHPAGYSVKDFWSREIWTTSRYRDSRGNPMSSR